jgi:hypothetical protein
MAEGVGFEPTVTFLPRSISSRVPSTGLSHPSLIGESYYLRLRAESKERIQGIDANALQPLNAPSHDNFPF